METLLFEFTILILFTTLVSFIGRQFKLPLVLGYLLTGIVIAILGLSHGSGIHELLEVLSTLGITFLLFLIGIELNVVELKEVGAPSVVAGVGQILFTGILGTVIAQLFGFGFKESLFIALALTFSSTIIAVKLLNAAGDIYSLYGRISIGILLVQDFVAVFVLILLSIIGLDAGSSTQETLLLVGGTFLKLLILGGITYVFVYAGKYIFGYIAKLSQQEESTELFLLGTISWVLAFTFISTSLDLSLEIGAFLAGLSLSSTGYSMEIVAKIKPFRDFFIIIFFVLLGSQIELSAFEGLIVPTVIFSILVFFGNPLIVQFLLKLFGFSQRTNFLTGLTVSQIGEFSLILAAGAYKAGLMADATVSMITVVAIVTITLSSYAMMHSSWLYRVLQRPFQIIAKPTVENPHRKGFKHKVWENHVVLFGMGRVGAYIFEMLLKDNVPVVVVDYDPTLVTDMQEMLAKRAKESNSSDLAQVEVVYGDVEDTDLFEELFVSQAQLVISTINHFEDNLIIVEEIKTRAPDTPVWTVANFDYEVEALEEFGVNAVIWPHDVTRKHIARRLKRAVVSTHDNKVDVKKKAKNKK